MSPTRFVPVVLDGHNILTLTNIHCRPHQRSIGCQVAPMSIELFGFRWNRKPIWRRHFQCRWPLMRGRYRLGVCPGRRRYSCYRKQLPSLPCSYWSGVYVSCNAYSSHWDIRNGGCNIDVCKSDLTSRRNHRMIHRAYIATDRTHALEDKLC
jgi:hypothetical protein